MDKKQRIIAHIIHFDTAKVLGQLNGIFPIHDSITVTDKKLLFSSFKNLIEKDEWKEIHPQAKCGIYNLLLSLF